MTPFRSGGAGVGFASPGDGSGGAPSARDAASCTTRAGIPEGFARVWDERLGRSPLANFSMRTDYLRWEAMQGRHAVLVLAEGAGRRGAIVLREIGRELHSGWPWRWQAVIESPEPGHAPGCSDAEAEWLFAHAGAHAAGRRVRMFLPARPVGGTPAFPAGATIVQALRASDDELLAAMDANKRRLHRRALAAGYDVGLVAGPAEAREFAVVQHEAARLREDGLPPGIDESPPEGHGFREWELPWMGLLVARHEGRVVAGVGDGLAAGAMVDGRAAAASPEARRAGVMALLCHHEARWLRDLGHDWLNHGGDTVFKREVAGQLGRRLVLWCWMGGGPAWELPNRTEAWARNARPRVAAWVRAVGVRGPKKGKTA